MRGCSRALRGLLILAALGGCRRTSDSGAPVVIAGASVAHGRDAVRAYGCGACHLIPGVRGARGMVGPPLVAWGQRTFIAGQVPNTPASLIRWIRTPQAIEPGTAMPDLGVTDGDARDIAAYLYTLR